MSSSRISAMFVLAGLLAAVCLLSPAHAANTLTANHTGPAPTVCPAHCACFIVTTLREHYNLAKCTALDGLAVYQKTAVIHTVDISHLGLERLGHQLDKFTNLSHIVLSHNRLAALPATLVRARRLRGLYLDHNRITSAKLHGIPETVQHLNLSHNHLTSVPFAELHRLQQLHTIALAGNPINCTCETLQARTWLAKRHVTVDDVRCATPAALKGMSWQLLNAEDVCGAEHDVNIWMDGDNELMLNDGAVASDDETAAVRDDDFDRDFIPIARKLGKRHLEVEDDLPAGAVVDGSGDAEASGELSSVSESLARLANIAESDGDSYGENYDDDGGSGSGDDGIPVIAVVSEQTTTVEAVHDDDATATTTDDTDDDDDLNNHVTHTDLHIFKIDDEPVDTTLAPVIVEDENEAIQEKPIDRMVDTAHPHKISAAEKENAESTYIVLVMLAILLLGLIVFVAIRRKNRRRQFSTLNNDAENGNAKELVDMNRAHPGKPSQSNGNGAGEVLPLIGARDKWDSRIQPAHGLSMPDQEELRRAQEPLLRRIDGESAQPNESPEPEQRPEPMPRTHVKRPTSGGSVGDVGATPSGGDAETNNNEQPPAPANDADQIDRPASSVSDNEPQVFQPISPKPARYSPVYSPETGRVKIKMLETARPRTPMLVSRSRSNAGDIVSTPLRPAK